MGLHENLAARDVPRRLGYIPDGPEGVRITLEYMRQLVLDYKTRPEIRLLAEQITAHLPAKDWPAEAAAIHDWVRDNIRYQRDPHEVEQIKDPVLLLETRAGDCDDFAVLTAALLESIGHPARFIAVAFDDASFSHVFVETKIGERWIASDASEPQGLGWVPPGIRGRMPRHV